jgi:prepilin-type processing-associated H-X9-DG protein
MNWMNAAYADGSVFGRVPSAVIWTADTGKDSYSASVPWCSPPALMLSSIPCGTAAKKKMDAGHYAVDP